MSTEPRRRPLLRVLTALGAVAFALGLVEWGQREAEARSDVRIPRDTPGIKYLLSPGGHQNSHGWREREVPLEKPSGTRRIAVLGDSVTHGGNLPAEHTWPRALEDALGRGVQVLNFAVVGYDVESVEAVLRTRVPAWEPDLVVYGFYVNDTIATELLSVAGHPVWVATAARDFRVIHPAVDAWLHGQSALFRLVEGAVAARAVDARGAQKPGDWAFFERHADALVADAARIGVPLVVLLIPPHTFSQPDLATCNAAAGEGQRFCENNADILARADAFFAARGVPRVDGVAAYRAGGTADFHFLPHDAHHPDRAGHRRLADALVPVVRELLP